MEQRKEEEEQEEEEEEVEQKEEAETETKERRKVVKWTRKKRGVIGSGKSLYILFGKVSLFLHRYVLIALANM